MPPHELDGVLATLLRSRALGRRIGPLLQALLLAQLLAGAAHDRPPHASHRAPRAPGRPPRRGVPRRGSMAGRRPRG